MSVNTLQWKTEEPVARTRERSHNCTIPAPLFLPLLLFQVAVLMRNH